MNDGDREVLVRSAIEACKAKGLKIAHSTWGIDWNKSKERWISKSPSCCAMACVILEYQDTQRKLNWRAWTIEKILAVNSEWIRNFQLGFDGHKKSAYDDGSFAFELGELMRIEYIDDKQLKLL